MKFTLVLPLSAALLLSACGPSATESTAKVDPTTEPWYAESTTRLNNIDRTAEQLFQAGRTQEAAAIITSGQPLENRLLTAPRPTLAAMEAVSDLDHIYGRMLMSNGFFGEARLLFQKNVTRWKTWKQPSPETEARLKAANDAIAECDRHMGA